MITGPRFFALASWLVPVRSVAFTLPDRYVEKTNLGMRRRPKTIKSARDAVRFDCQYRFQVDIGVVGQRAIELAMVIDEDCMELGIDRSPTGVASWCDGRRHPLYWVGSDDPKACGIVLMYECRRVFADDRERLPTSFKAVEELLVNAQEAYDNI